jgi:hypothetical protein
MASTYLSVSGFTFLDNLHFAVMQEILPNGDLPFDIHQWAARSRPGARTKLLAVILAAGLVSPFHISSYSTLVRVLAQACIGPATCACTATLSPLTLTALATYVSRIRFACSVPMKWIVRQTSGIQGTYMPIRMYASFLVHMRDIGFLAPVILMDSPYVCQCVGQTVTSGQWVEIFCHALPY